MKAFSHYPLLAYLAQTKLTKKFIAALPKEIIHAICEIALNLKQGNIELTSSQASFFAKHSRQLNILAARSASLERKKKILTPSFLKLILSSALTRLEHGYKNEASA